MLTCVFGSLAEVVRYPGMRMGALPGVAASRKQIPTALHTEGSRWRLDEPAGAARRGTVPGAAGPEPGRSAVRREACHQATTESALLAGLPVQGG
ncbi:hypothetical protein [Streptomyces sp. 142MFCol3.1]|uniref:hypothetical protein n=1 Tax=Streptomyces sp. 142MFCol3.1 TaxID=1172179 RepID=UPI0003F911A1|nr:hypothetical protein [Streptomyces sp. 142MFCol3.1]